MKSRIIVCLVLCFAAPALQVSAQVMPLGQVPQQGEVQPASCQSCAEPSMSFYGTTVWGTDCFDCNTKPGLFPPCPNPCRTTLLGELVLDVKMGLDATLSHVFGCLFVDPCGYRGGRMCSEPVCNSCIGDRQGGAMEMSTMSMPMQATQGGGDFYTDPFRDDPVPTPAVQPRPTRSARSIVPRRRPAARRAARPSVARRTSYERPSPPRPPRLQPQAMRVVDSQPILSTRPSAAQHYHPRRSATLRRANGQELVRVPVRQDGSSPPLRFRETN